MSSVIAQQKKELRARLRKNRSNIDPQISASASASLVKRLQQLPEYQQARRVACFFSFDGEINTAPLIKTIIQQKDLCYLPRLRPTKPSRLWFLPFDGQSPLAPNRFGINEVDLPINHSIGVSRLDLILMPLVAFDIYGNRLGMGGGFYDATLAHLKTNGSKHPVCIGLAYQLQQVARLPVESWDFKMDGVLTEEKFYPG